MTIYGWKCKECGTIIDAPGALPCPVCGNMMKKDWGSVNLVVTPFKPHFNHSVGRYVNTSREFDEALRRGAEEQNTTYQRIDPGDFASIEPTTSTDALELHHKIKYDAGETPRKVTHIPL